MATHQRKSQPKKSSSKFEKPVVCPFLWVCSETNEACQGAKITRPGDIKNHLLRRHVFDSPQKLGFWCLICIKEYSYEVDLQHHKDENNCIQRLNQRKAIPMTQLHKIYEACKGNIGINLYFAICRQLCPGMPQPNPYRYQVLIPPLSAIRTVSIVAACHDGLNRIGFPPHQIRQEVVYYVVNCVVQQLNIPTADNASLADLEQYLKRQLNSLGCINPTTTIQPQSIAQFAPPATGRSIATFGHNTSELAASLIKQQQISQHPSASLVLNHEPMHTQTQSGMFNLSKPNNPSQFMWSPNDSTGQSLLSQQYSQPRNPAILDQLQYSPHMVDNEQQGNGYQSANQSWPQVLQQYNQGQPHSQDNLGTSPYLNPHAGPATELRSDWFM